ncbi:MAG: hypothetical protein R3B70_15220 [Polyangiaceae bacterium]
MNVRRILCSAVLLGLAACSSSSSDDGTTGAPPPPPATTTTTTSSLVLTTEGPPTKAGIEPRVKAEVDQRTDGLTGTTLAVSGARAALQVPKDWTTKKGAVTTVESADKKAQMAATSFSGSPDAQITAATAALGLTACEWNPPENLAIGKTLVAGNGADGRCTKGTAQVKAAFVAGPAEGVLVVGAWEDGGDSASIFGAMRSIVRAAGSGTDGIGACCAALRQNANSAPPDQKNGLLQAAAICDGLRNSPQGKAALGQIRGLLKGANMPSSCK